MNRPRTIRRAIGGLLLGAALSATLIPAAHAEVTQTYGRVAPSVTSGSARWVASAQGETIDNTALRGRAAVQETVGLKRARVYRVTTQARINNTWITVQNNDTDKISDAPRAYAVQVTSPTRYCEANPGLQRTYRVVNTYGVRKDNGAVVNKTLYSNTFEARALSTDPACVAPLPLPPDAPKADLEIDVQGDSPLQHGQVQDLDVLIRNLGPGTAGNATAVVDFSPGLVVDSADPRAVLRSSSADPNDYLVNLGVFGAGESENIDFDVLGDVVGGQSVKAWVDGSVEPSDHDEDTLYIQVIKSADLSLTKTVNLAEVYSGGPVTYTFTVHNNGPDVATGVTLTDQWPAELSPPNAMTPGNLCSFDEAADVLTCNFGDVAVGGTETIQVSAPASSQTPVTVTNTASVVGNEADPDAADRTDSASFGIVGNESTPAEEPVPGDEEPVKEPGESTPVEEPGPSDEPVKEPAPEPQPQPEPQPEPVVPEEGVTAS